MHSEANPLEENAAFPVRLSIGVIARNEEDVIEDCLESLFEQSLFRELARRNLKCEVLCLANGCTDKTVSIARACFERHSQNHPHRDTFICRVLDLEERGKLTTWNHFVHQASAREARFLVQMDGDILLHNPDTLWNLYRGLVQHPEAVVSVDEPIKDVAFHRRRTWRDRLSLGGSAMTRSGRAQMTGQLYCIRAATARNIYMPRDLTACEDGFIKWLVCTDFFTGQYREERILQVANASHIFEAYTSLPGILRNQKRQMIGQTMIHLLLDQHLPKINLEQKRNLATYLQERDASEPAWLARLVAEHLRTRRFYQLFPGIPGFAFRRWRQTRGIKRWLLLPVAALRWTLMMVSCWLAYRFLKAGSLFYWPETRSPGLKKLKRNLEKPGEIAVETH